MHSIAATASDTVWTAPDMAGRPWWLVRRAAVDAMATEALTTPWLQVLRHAHPRALIEYGASCLNTPVEHVRARLLGLPADDGAIPWAALRARQRGLDAARTWAFVHPCHWRVGAEHTVVDDPAQLQLDAAAAQGLLEAMQPYFTEDGLTLVADGPARWLVHGAPLQGLRTASLERVLGRDVARFAGDGDAARRLRRLQSEMQMLLYQHPLHDERTRQGLLPVNSFWLDGVGSLPAGFATRQVHIHETSSTACEPPPLALPCNVAWCGEHTLAVLTLPGEDTATLWARLVRPFSRGHRRRELLALLQHP